VKITEEHLLATLHKDLPLWMIQDGRINREIVFRDFVSAFAFMCQVAELAEQQEHHPWWCNEYNKLHIALHTHDVGAITDKDLLLAKSIDNLYLTLHPAKS
jgi:4a-hydroxytetrahydrobiopterin dehydratase